MKNNISYCGRVTIKIKDKPPVRKNNAGTSVLFKTLCNILTNTVIDYKPNIPCYMSILSADNISDNNLLSNTDYKNEIYLEEELISSLLPISSRNTIDTIDSPPECEFSALFPHSQALTNKSNPENCYIVMLDSKNKIMAFVKISFDDISVVFTDSSAQAAITWNMSFTNADKKQEENK